MTERPKTIEIDTDQRLCALTFTANGECLVSGHEDGVQVWRGKHCVATMEAKSLKCVAVSKDGRWIAAGTSNGEVYVWDAGTHKEASRLKKDILGILGVDFSPDSTRLVSASKNCIATIWRVNSRKQTQLLHHEDWVVAAKHSPQGDRIVTATTDHVRVWDSNDGTLLISVLGKVPLCYNQALVWRGDHLFFLSGQSIMELDASTGSMVSEWQVSDADTNVMPCVILQKREKFVAYAMDHTAMLWDTSTRSTIGQIQRSGYIRSVAISPDDCWIATAEHDGKVVVESVSHAIGSFSLSCLHAALQGPVIQIEDTILDVWRHGQLDVAGALLDAMIADSSIPDHDAFASRALIRARLQSWEAALADAEKAIAVEPSVIGYIAKSIVHVGMRDRHKAYRSCDIAIERFHSDHVTFLSLIKSIVVFIAEEHVDAISRVDDLIATYPLMPTFYVVQAHMLFLQGNTLMELSDYEAAIQSFERARAQLRPYRTESLFLISLIFGWKFDNLDLTIRQRMCEALHLAGRVATAGESLLDLVRTFEKQVHTSQAIVKWVSHFTQKCLTTPGCYPASNVTRDTGISVIHLSLLKEWAWATLACGSWKTAFVAATNFIIPRFAAYRAICEHLEATKCTADATECLLKVASEMSRAPDVQMQRFTAIKYWLTNKLERYGGAAINARRHNDAIVLYSAGLSLDHGPLISLFANRSKARANLGWWKDALDDAIQVTTLDPTLPMGYERKYAALRGAGCYGAAEVAFETMLSKMSQSPDTAMRVRSRQYVEPAETENAIREVVEEVVRKSPPVLIDTHSGRLLDKDGRALSFETQPIFHELVSSTTTRIDRSRIQDEVGHYYRYATFSHKWKENEPSYDDVIHLVVYGLEQSPTHKKLQKFCEMARDAGLLWAWSDTCCIKKSDSSVLQEALVSMYQWYKSSTLTVVLLCDTPLNRLFDSVWNSRAWTFQEYHASKVVRFYNKDWTLYQNIDIPNHKESPEIIAEMEEATGISARALMALQPGLAHIREKLRLASTRQSARVEDVAYSLLGIFSLSMSIEYGEGDRALGRLLAQLLASSGDTSILAWTGMSGSFNSCLPADITVFSQSLTSYIPPPMTSADMETAIAGLHKAPLNLALLTEFLDLLDKLPVPQFSGKRMMLPCIVFKLGRLSVSRSGSECIFRAKTRALGIVKIKANEDLSRFSSLLLVHPWFDFLLGRRPGGGATETLTEGQPRGGVIDTILEESTEDQSLTGLSSPGPSTASRLIPHFGLFGRRSATHDLMSDAQSDRPPSTVSDTDRQMDAFRVLARLKQPFAALLLAPDPHTVSAYNRVAAGTLITVQVVEEMTQTLLDKLMRSVDTLDVL